MRTSCQRSYLYSGFVILDSKTQNYGYVNYTYARFIRDGYETDTGRIADRKLTDTIDHRGYNN